MATEYSAYMVESVLLDGHHPLVEIPQLVSMCAPVNVILDCFLQCAHIYHSAVWGIDKDPYKTGCMKVRTETRARSLRQTLACITYLHIHIEVYPSETPPLSASSSLYIPPQCCEISPHRYSHAFKMVFSVGAALGYRIHLHSL